MGSNNSTLVGTVGGTFLSVLPNVDSEDIFKTIFLAAVVALGSFTLSLILKFIIKKHKE